MARAGILSQMRLGVLVSVSCDFERLEGFGEASEGDRGAVMRVVLETGIPYDFTRL
jgi:hypothetical protein